MNVLLSVLDDLLQRMSSVLQRYNIDPRELSQEQLYKLALILQLVQGQEKTGMRCCRATIFVN